MWKKTIIHTLTYKFQLAETYLMFSINERASENELVNKKTEDS